MKEFTISMPLYIDLPRKTKKDKRCYINMNQYRNLHYLINNQLKKAYKEIARPKLEGIVFDNPVELTFVLWKKDKRKGDRANPLSIHEKFFCDALTECGSIPDDNDQFIHATHYYTGGIDKENPRVEIIVKEV